MKCSTVSTLCAPNYSAPRGEKKKKDQYKAFEFLSGKSNWENEHMRRLKEKNNNFPFIETQGKLGQSPQTSSEFQHSLNSVLFFYYHYTFFVLQYQISLAWEFLCVPSEGFCYLHTRQEAAAASSFHSWCTATHQERLGCLFFFFTGFQLSADSFLPQSSRPAAKLSLSTILNPSPGRKHCWRRCECLKSVQMDSEGGKQIDQIVICREDAA